MGWRFYIRQHEVLGPWYARIERRPSWVAQIALIAAALVVVVPIVLLAMAAVVVGLAVFIVLGLVAQLAIMIRLGWARITSAGLDFPNRNRRNVRVIRPK